MKVDFFRHNLDESDCARVLDVLRGRFLTTGEVSKEFEKRFAEYLGVPYVVGVTSCTAGLHLSLLAAGITEGDEVITTPLSFIATANAIEYVGARPVFVDVESRTGNIDVNNIESAITPRTKAIIPVHLYGQLCDMKQLQVLANKHALTIVEDAAHAVEGVRDGMRSGTAGHYATFSFYATKNITSGEGGAIAVHDVKTRDFLKRLSLHGMSTNAADRYTKKYEHYDMELLGWKYNMTNIQGALLLNQLTRIEESLKHRERLSKNYERAFSGVSGIEFLEVLPRVKSARHLFTILVSPERRDATMHSLQEGGIGVAVNFRPIHLMKYYREKYGFQPGAFPNAEYIGARTLTLPLYPSLSEDEQRYVIDTVLSVVQA